MRLLTALAVQGLVIFGVLLIAAMAFVFVADLLPARKRRP